MIKMFFFALLISAVMIGCAGKIVFQPIDPYANIWREAQVRGYGKVFHTYVDGEEAMTVLTFDVGRTQFDAEHNALHKGMSIMNPGLTGSGNIRVVKEISFRRHDGLWRAECLLAVPCGGREHQH